MGFAEISTNDRVWEIIYASVFLEGEEREKELKRLGVEEPKVAENTIDDTA